MTSSAMTSSAWMKMENVVQAASRHPEDSSGSARAVQPRTINGFADCFHRFELFFALTNCQTSSMLEAAAVRDRVFVKLFAKM